MNQDKSNLNFALGEEDKELKELLILEEARKIKTVFLDNMSHELRTPITVILGYAGILYEEIDDPDLKEMAEIILKSSNRLTESLNLLLDQSDIDSNRLKVEVEKHNLSELLREQYYIYKPIAEDRGLGIEFVSEVSEAFCEIDKKMFDKIMSNLLNNSIKFTEKGGITLSISENNYGDHLHYRVDVTDTGIGIPEDKQNLIFEAFRQVSEGMNRLYQGTGLGLSVTKKFVELMNGKISLVSKVNSGTTISMLFPAKK